MPIAENGGLRRNTRMHSPGCVKLCASVIAAHRFWYATLKRRKGLQLRLDTQVRDFLRTWRAVVYVCALVPTPGRVCTRRKTSSGQPDLGQRARPDRERRAFDQADQLVLLRGAHPGGVNGR